MSKRRQEPVRQEPREGVTDLFPGAGERIETLRRRARGAEGHRLTQGELADKAEISRATYSVAVNQDRLTARTARKLAAVLDSTEEAILYGESVSGQWDPRPDVGPPTSREGEELEEWISNLDRIVLTLRNFPGGEVGQKLKVGFLNAVEDIARDTGNKLPLEYYALRKRVQDGEL